MKELNDFRKFIQENELHEGTWSLGTTRQMKDEISTLEALIKKAYEADDPKKRGRGFTDGFKQYMNNENIEDRLYRVFGDDSFHDYWSIARREANTNRFDAAANSLIDAVGRAKELLKSQEDYENRDRFEEGEVNEIFGEKGNQRIKVSNDMKIGKALSALEDALFELNFLGVISDNDYNNFWMDKYGELYMDTMGQLDPSVQKKYDYEGLDESEGLEENDKILDEIVDESFIGDLATRIRKRRAAKKEKERFTKGLDMKDFRGQGAPEIDPEFTAGLEEEKDEE